MTCMQKSHNFDIFAFQFRPLNSLNSSQVSSDQTEGDAEGQCGGGGGVNHEITTSPADAVNSSLSQNSREKVVPNSVEETQFLEEVRSFFCLFRLTKFAAAS